VPGLPAAVLILVRHDQHYELTIQAEALAFSGAKLPASEGRKVRTSWESASVGSAT